MKFQGLDVLIISIFVLFIGRFVTFNVPVLRRFNIPQAVTGGLLCSLFIALLYKISGVKITFDMQLRDILLLVFFSTIGLNAKFDVLKQGGRSLLILVVLAFVFLMLQDGLGILLAIASGHEPAYGLFAGSISLAGGHGTAIAWGKLAREAGLHQAETLGLAMATFGLIAGGLLGGPVAERFIKRDNLKPNPQNTTSSSPTPTKTHSTIKKNTFDFVMRTVLALAFCVELGDIINRHLFAKGVVVPGFLTAMLSGIIITNLLDWYKRPLQEEFVSDLGNYCLQFFLSMSLMSIDISALASSMNVLFALIAVQSLLMAVFASLFVFRCLGQDYDAAVISGGFVGLGLGSTPVAIANMSAVTNKYGPSSKAFLVVPIVGAFFIDILNSLVIQQYIAWFS